MSKSTSTLQTAAFFFKTSSVEQVIRFLAGEYTSIEEGFENECDFLQGVLDEQPSSAEIVSIFERRTLIKIDDLRRVVDAYRLLCEARRHTLKDVASMYGELCRAAS